MVFVTRSVGAALVLALLVTACQDDREVSLRNRCGVEIEFFMFSDSGLTVLNEATLGDLVTLSDGDQRKSSLYSDVVRVDVYSNSREYVFSIDTDGGSDIAADIQTGCEVLASGAE